MRAVSPALRSYLDKVRAGTTPLLMADCYTLSPAGLAPLTCCDKDVPLTVGATVFAANSLRIGGLAFKCATGLDVDTQKIEVIFSPSDLVGGVPFAIALRNGALDGCGIQRDRAFFTSWTQPAIGSVTLFKGRLTTVDSLGRTSASVTVASDLLLLDQQMPRNFYQPNCNNALYDGICGLSKASFTSAGAVGTGSTRGVILWSGAAANFVQGTIAFTSGLNNGVSTGVKSAVAGTSLTLLQPLQSAPQPGDTFSVSWGCDRTLATCRAKFNNAANFRGFPFIPPPSTAYSSGVN